MAHEIAISYFNEPVDADGLGIPEYLDVIKVGTKPPDHGHEFVSRGMDAHRQIQFIAISKHPMPASEPAKELHPNLLISDLPSLWGNWGSWTQELQQKI